MGAKADFQGGADQLEARDIPLRESSTDPDGSRFGWTVTCSILIEEYGKTQDRVLRNDRKLIGM